MNRPIRLTRLEAILHAHTPGFGSITVPSPGPAGSSPGTSNLLPSDSFVPSTLPRLSSALPPIPSPSSSMLPLTHSPLLPAVLTLSSSLLRGSKIDYRRTSELLDVMGIVVLIGFGLFFLSRSNRVPSYRSTCRGVRPMRIERFPHASLAALSTKRRFRY